MGKSKRTKARHKNVSAFDTALTSTSCRSRADAFVPISMLLFFVASILDSAGRLDLATSSSSFPLIDRGTFESHYEGERKVRNCLLITTTCRDIQLQGVLHHSLYSHSSCIYRQSSFL